MIYGDLFNCNVVGHGTRSEYQCRLGYEIISEDTSTNSRQVKLQLEARTISDDYKTWGIAQVPTIDGLQLTGTLINLRTKNAWQVFGTRIITINGAFKGTKTGSFVSQAVDEWALKSGSASVYIELENLHTPPVINSIDTQEVNSSLNGYDGIVQFLSLKNFTFETTTYDNATISSYQVLHNGILIGSSTQNGMTVDFNEVGTLATFVMNDKIYCTLEFRVIDSYNTFGSIKQNFEVVQYVKPSLVQTSSNIKRNGQTSGKVKLNLVGSFYNNVINDIQNTIKLGVTYWKKGGEVSSEYYEIPFETASNKIELYNWSVAIDGTEITDVDKDSAYVFSIIAVDYFGQGDQVLLLCPVGEYVWAEFKDRVDFKNITIKGQPLFSDTGWISVNDYVSYRVKDGYVCVVGEASPGTLLSANSYTNVASLPYAPTVDVPFIVASVGGNKFIEGIVGVGGNVNLYATSATDYWRFSVVYPI